MTSTPPNDHIANGDASALDTIIPNESRSELRLAEEVAVFIETATDLHSTQSQISVSKTLDISANGLQLITDQKLIEKSVLQLCIDIGEERFFVSAEVLWCQGDMDEFRVGLRLLDSLNTHIDKWKAFICKRLANN